jgi:4-hydroxybenzoate polyprenyltransferase
MLGYLRLIRLPNVFTAIADIIAGFFILNGVESNGWKLSALICASASLYLCGMAFNDVADREEDARVRPGRPIPSGQVSLCGAVLCGIALLCVGLISAALASWQSLMTAGILAFCILQYDFWGKGKFLTGPISLGLCRFMNVTLGMSLDERFATTGFPQANLLDAPWAPALAVGIYAAGLTAFSAQEESGKQLRAIIAGWFFCGGAIALVALSGQYQALWITLAPLSLVLLWLTIRLKKLATPWAARDLVRTGVMGVCFFDASLIFGAGGVRAWPWALTCVVLLIPAILIARSIAQKEA